MGGPPLVAEGGPDRDKTVGQQITARAKLISDCGGGAKRGNANHQTQTAKA